MVHIPKLKGSAKRAFDIPLSREMILCLIRAIRFGRAIHPAEAMEWVFPADSASGHLAEQKEDRAMLSKWGNDLRQSFRTIATAAGVPEFDAKLLMNQALLTTPMDKPEARPQSRDLKALLTKCRTVSSSKLSSHAMSSPCGNHAARAAASSPSPRPNIAKLSLKMHGKPSEAGKHAYGARLCGHSIGVIPWGLVSRSG